MNINWKIRFQNKTFLTGLISLVDRPDLSGGGLHL